MPDIPDEWEKCVKNVLLYDPESNKYFRDKTWKSESGVLRKERVPTDFPKWG